MALNTITLTHTFSSGIMSIEYVKNMLGTVHYRLVRLSSPVGRSTRYACEIFPISCEVYSIGLWVCPHLLRNVLDRFVKLSHLLGGVLDTDVTKVCKDPPPPRLSGKVFDMYVRLSPSVGRCTRWDCIIVPLVVTYGMTGVFSGYFDFLNQ